MGATKLVYYVPDLMKIAGRSRTWVQEALRNNVLPKPVRIGKRSAWPKSQIDRLFGLDTATTTTSAS
ncbi:hypothetical protein J8F10_30400 [Gemmata sp. G18]|uniref:DNA-binding protein n=1 Tax=Gemmata palustris TaxID=2822762 RepID=A0ABS5C1N7_9BACT|nr:hypothetical protein [Gemmata palustris]MBP3959577.1 hypothetical protein [Gemmata palustris]